ncbi:MAG: copper-translocating P-type ATPase [Spirochaetaceae bacterium]|nr:copper-translocating P-type ATPase [Spirochaetaceae bacterium]
MDHEHHEHHDHNDHHRMMISDFQKRFFVTLALTVPVLIMDTFVQSVLGFSVSFPGMNYVVFAIATVIYIYGGWPFLSGLINEIRAKLPGMMTLIGLAISVAYLYSVAVTAGLDGVPFYWELATLIVIMLAGHWIEMASVLGASSALEKLAALMPDTAHRVSIDGSVEDIPLSAVANGDILLVKPGEKVPSDGILAEGSGTVDESMLTGESRPVRKKTGDRLIGGAVNGVGSFRISVSASGEESYLSQVIKLVREAQAVKSRTQALSDKAAFWLTIVAVTVGISTLVAWLIAGRGLQFSITRMATVMIITCPHALGLAIPLVVSVSTAKSAQKGLLIRNRTAFENARKITTVIFDKTGTLTVGSFEARTILPVTPFSENDILSMAAGVEASSEHPIAEGIMKAAKNRKIEVPASSEFEALPGKGAKADIDGTTVMVVSPGWLESERVNIPKELILTGAGMTVVYVVKERNLVGAIGLSDALRPESRDAIRTLQKKGIKCWMLTGDNKETAQSVAEELGMDGWFAEVLPHQKKEKVEELQRNGEYIAMTGDGVNDSPALAQAQVGIAVGSGTDVAAASADIILVNSNPQDIVSLVLFGAATYRKMIQNLIWATGYNVLAIPLAAGVLYNYGVVLSPEIGAVLMTISTVVVAINARLLRMPKMKIG